jgi:magnesium transporter
MAETATVPHERLAVDELGDAWPVLSAEERLHGFRLLGPEDAQDFFLTLSPRDQAVLLRTFDRAERRAWIRMLAPDDAADVIQILNESERAEYLSLLDDSTRKEVAALLAYAEDEAGGLMNPRFARVRPEMTVDEAIRYLRREAYGRTETLYYVYVLDAQQRLLGVLSFRELFAAPPGQRVRDIMHTDLVTAHEDLDQEALSRLLVRHDLLALPVVAKDGVMKGIVTVHDVVDAVQEEATEDIQKIGGSEALDAPFLELGPGQMIRKRAGWLSALFIGETLTASAMARFEHQLAQVVLLAVFVPLIISSGGNSGAQASTLVIRSLALGEVRLRDWWRVARRELSVGSALGGILAVIGLGRVLLWEQVFGAYGPEAVRLAATVSLSLLGIVLLGSLVGSMLPFLLRRAGLDPATASAPFVATLVDVSGVLIYFTIATLILF